MKYFPNSNNFILPQLHITKIKIKIRETFLFTHYHPAGGPGRYGVSQLGSHGFPSFLSLPLSTLFLSPFHPLSPPLPAHGSRTARARLSTVRARLATARARLVRARSLRSRFQIIFLLLFLSSFSFLFSFVS